MSNNLNIAPAVTELPKPGFSAFAEIDTNTLRQNIRTLKKQAGSVEIMAVVKADAYGHGVESISTFLMQEGISRFMVATLAEALHLRTHVPGAQILVASPPDPANLEVYRANQLDASVTSALVAEGILRSLSEGPPLSVHAKIDTGMNRLGISQDTAPRVIEELLDSPKIKVAGMWTHLATAGDADTSFASQQIENAYAIVNTFPSFDGYFHVGNSGALLNLRDKFGHRDQELVRLGGALLGIPASRRLARQFGLAPIMSLKSRVVHCKTLEQGAGVSYGCVWKAPSPTRIAVVGAGYADGYPSALTGKAHVYIHGIPYPIIGRICMDMFMIDIGLDNNEVLPGDEVLLFGNEHVNIYDLAKMAGLVHYEICCRIPKRVPRNFV